jgi:hypothetical protein
MRPTVAPRTNSATSRSRGARAASGERPPPARPGLDRDAPPLGIGGGRVGALSRWRVISEAAFGGLQPVARARRLLGGEHDLEAVSASRRPRSFRREHRLAAPPACRPRCPWIVKET